MLPFELRFSKREASLRRAHLLFYAGCFFHMFSWIIFTYHQISQIIHSLNIAISLEI